jgi:hypothetical protein
MHSILSQLGVGGLYCLDLQQSSVLQSVPWARAARPNLERPLSSLPPRSRSLPPKRVLTLNLEVPEAWLVEATKAVYDLDNLRLVRARARPWFDRGLTRFAPASGQVFLLVFGLVLGVRWDRFPRLRASKWTPARPLAAAPVAAYPGPPLPTQPHSPRLAVPPGTAGGRARGRGLCGVRAGSPHADRSLHRGAAGRPQGRAAAGAGAATGDQGRAAARGHPGGEGWGAVHQGEGLT